MEGRHDSSEVDYVPYRGDPAEETSRVGPGWFGCAEQAGLFLAGEREANLGLNLNTEFGQNSNSV